MVEIFFDDSKIGIGKTEDSNALRSDDDCCRLFMNFTLYVPPVPSFGFVLDRTKIPLESEILQSFLELTDMNIRSTRRFYYGNTDYYDYRDLNEIEEEILIGNNQCHLFQSHDVQTADCY